MSSRSDVSFRAIARRRMSAFRRNQEGAAAIEFVLWMPFFIVLLAIITDFTFLYMTNASMWSSAREADAAEASNMITSSLIRGGNYYVKVDPLSSEVSAIIRIGMADASIFGIFGSVLNDDLVAIVRMRKEPMD
jgi:Flp pilus assembly pilin Flp